MPDPTLDLTKNYLDAEIGNRLGYGYGNVVYSETAWTTAQQVRIDAIRGSGLRMFYLTEAVPELGVPAGYAWSFLRPVAQLSLPSAAKVIPLPDDFGGIDGTLYLVGSDRAYREIPIAGSRVRHMYALHPDTTGAPEFADVEPAGRTTPNAGQRWQLRVWPAADQDYTLELTYVLSPDDLTSTLPRVQGGAVHAETLKAACLRAAEMYLNDGQDGLMGDLFRSRLAASVAADRKFKPQWAGYVGDPSDSRYNVRFRRPANFPQVTYNGNSLS